MGKAIMKCKDPQCSEMVPMTERQKYDSRMTYAREQAAYSRKPLERKGTSDAWNERQRRLASGRLAARLMLEATMMYNKAK